MNETTDDSQDNEEDGGKHLVRNAAVAATAVLATISLAQGLNEGSEAKHKTSVPASAGAPDKANNPAATPTEIGTAADLTSTIGAPGPEVTATQTFSAPESTVAEPASEVGSGITVTSDESQDPGPVAVDPTIATGNGEDTAHGENGGMPTTIPGQNMNLPTNGGAATS